MSNPFFPLFPKGKTSQSEAPNASQSEVPNASQSEIPKALQPLFPIGPNSPIATPTTPPDTTTSVPVSTQSSSTQATFTFTGDSTATPTINASDANYIVNSKNTAVVAARIFGILIGLTAIACGIALLMRKRTPRKKLLRPPNLPF